MALDTFDYVVIGGGAAGCIVAARLAEKGATVCLLEAGPRDSHPYFHIPAGFIRGIQNPYTTWGFVSEASEGTAGRRLSEIQARVLGGGGSINGMIFSRGQAADFNAWAQAGNHGWGFDDVLPYFKRIEKTLAPLNGDLRGRSGPIPVAELNWTDPLSEAFMRGAHECGLPYVSDYNSGKQFGVAAHQVTIARGWRRSSARQYLYPAMKRHNIDVRTQAFATRILFDDLRASGVTYLRHGKPSEENVTARREIIVCAGAINTPKLLQISGIGRASHLQNLGVQVLCDLPAGEHLKNHFSVKLVARVQNCITLNEHARGLRLGVQVARWLLGKPSILALPPVTILASAKSDPIYEDSDFQCVFAPGSSREGTFGLLDTFSGATVGVRQNRPESTGYVRAHSQDSHDPPIIQPNYLATQKDQQVVISGIKFARNILHSHAMRSYFAQEIAPGEEAITDDQILNFAQCEGTSGLHFTSSARMGPHSDGSSVVDNYLRVHRTTGLRIADASIMPDIPSANTYAATMMIAEKASDLILGEN